MPDAPTCYQQKPTYSLYLMSAQSPHNGTPHHPNGRLGVPLSEINYDHSSQPKATPCIPPFWMPKQRMRDWPTPFSPKWLGSGAL